MNNPIVQILQGTPIWIFALFALLIWLGIRRLRPSTMPISRVWLVPGVFIAWGLVGLFSRTGPLEVTAMHWLLAAVLGIALGVMPGMSLQVDRQRRLVRQPASTLPLLRNMAIFGAHYLLNVAAAIQPMHGERYMGWDVVVSGFSAGFFIGWAIRFALSVRSAPSFDTGQLVASKLAPTATTTGL